MGGASVQRVVASDHRAAEEREALLRALPKLVPRLCLCGDRAVEVAKGKAEAVVCTVLSGSTWGTRSDADDKRPRRGGGGGGGGDGACIASCSRAWSCCCTRERRVHTGTLFAAP